MSYRTFFGLAVGLSKPITAPAGTLKSCQDHVAKVEATLGFRVERDENNPAYWIAKPQEGVSDDLLCRTALEHNDWIRRLYANIQEWHKKPPTGGTEVITLEDAQTFWHGLEIIHVPTERWTMTYYRDRMEHFYEVMRGRNSEGVSFDTKALTPKQAASVIILFAEFLDHQDIRLDVPNGHDSLRASYDGGYDWCTKCGPVAEEEVENCRKRNCPLRAERDKEDL